MNQPSGILRIALVGYGKMGKEIERIALERGMEITARADLDTPSLATDGVRQSDVVIHFATPVTVVGHVKELGVLKKPVVLGTTGWGNNRPAVEEIVRNSGIGLVHASNFSVGVNVLNRLVRATGQMMNHLTDYDVAVHEIHHKDKLDAPSGTALSLASILLETMKRKKRILSGAPDGKIQPEQLHISSERYGSVVGRHTVTFDSPADCLEIVHTAKNRSGFAMGALLAAEWIMNKQGMFTFDDVLEDVLLTRREG